MQGVVGIRKADEGLLQDIFNPSNGNRAFPSDVFAASLNCPAFGMVGSTLG